MKSRHQPHFPSRIAPWCLALPCIAGALHAHAEAPMHTDDAGTLAQGTTPIVIAWDFNGQSWAR